MSDEVDPKVLKRLQAAVIVVMGLLLIVFGVMFHLIQTKPCRVCEHVRHDAVRCEIVIDGDECGCRKDR